MGGRSFVFVTARPGYWKFFNFVAESGLNASFILHHQLTMLSNEIGSLC